MNPRKSTNASVVTLFNSVSSEDKLESAQSKLNYYQQLLEAKPDNTVIRNEVIRLNLECGVLCINKKDYTSAKQFLEAANGLADDNHASKFSISTKLLEVEQEILRHFTGLDSVD